MSKQVLVVDHKGGITGLVHKNSGVDLRTLGRAEIDRVTLIEWDSDNQAWYIRWYGSNGDEVWGEQMRTYVVNSPRCRLINWRLEDGKFLFNEYDEAVEFEVAVVQQLQKQGLV